MKSIRFWELVGAIGLVLTFTGCLGHQPIPTTEVIPSVSNDPKGIEKWVLQESYSIKSPTHVVLALVSEHGEVPRYVAAAPIIYSASSHYSRFAKNILFVDSNNNSSRWLFKKNAQLIEEYFSFPRVNYPPFMNNKKSEAKVIFYKVIDSDTNGDGKVTSQDNTNLAISDTAGKDYKVIVRDINRIISIKELHHDMFTIVYQKAGVGYSLNLHRKGFTEFSNKMLPKVGM